MWRTSLLLLACTATLSCGCIVPFGMAKLRNATPLDADPALLAVKLTLPDGVGVEKGSAKFSLSAIREDTDARSEQTYRLVPQQGTPDIYGLERDAMARLAQQQKLLRQWRAEAPDDTKGNVSVTASPCRIGDGPAQDARASVALRLNADMGMVPLIKDGPLSALFDDKTQNEMPDCH